MRYVHLRNAAGLLVLGEHRLMIDPMLADVGALPGFKIFGGGRRRNPLVPLPASTARALEEANGAIITHEHPDHLDRAGIRFLAGRGLRVWTNGVDAPSLSRKGLDAHVLVDGALGMRIETIRSRHGRGLLGWALGPVCGYYLAHPGEPSVYLVGDSILTPAVLDAVTRLSPDVLVLPAGAANMGLGGDILFSLDDIVQLAKLVSGHVVLNHLEALDHCPITRAEARARIDGEGLTGRVLIPEDGEEMTFGRRSDAPARSPQELGREAPGLQKWITGQFAASA